MEAEARAIEHGKKGYLLVTGFGLGMWSVLQKQKTWFVECFLDVLKHSDVKHIDFIDFSYIIDDKWHLSAVTKAHHTVKILYTKNPMAVETKPDQLLITTFAWDSNAFPGNEYWMRMLSLSGDPSAASCSTIPELQNPFINPFLDSQKIITVPKRRH